MLDWDFGLDVEGQPQGPMYLRVAAAIADGIRAGRLREGSPLPGTRRLARSLGVHRNTVLAAFRELSSEGLINARPNQGTFVAPTRTLGKPRKPGPPAAAFELPRLASATRDHAPAAPGTLRLSHLPSADEAPGVQLARAYRRAVRRHASTVLDYANRNGYGETLGMPRLREALAPMLARRRGLAVEAKDILVTSGSQMALYLLAHALVQPGDVVAVEAFGYKPVWEAFRLAGATLVPVPVDAHGLRVDDLREISRRTKLRAVYVTPHHQHPTAVTLAPDRRSDLLDFAAANGIAIIEDDYDADFAYDGQPTMPLASTDRRGCVVYVGSLSKVLAPGIRIGYAVATAPLLELMARRRAFIDRQGDHAMASAVAELLEDGDLRRHIQRLHALYQPRRDALVEALRRELGDAISFEVPTTGTAIWASVDRSIDLDAWHVRARDRGVLFSPGRTFAFEDAPTPFARFGFAALAPAELETAADRLAKALPGKAPVP